MSIKNKIYNWWHKIKRHRGEGCKNVVMITDEKGNKFIHKYDWDQPMTFHSQNVTLNKVGVYLLEEAK